MLNFLGSFLPPWLSPRVFIALVALAAIGGVEYKVIQAAKNSQHAEDARESLKEDAQSWKNSLQTVKEELHSANEKAAAALELQRQAQLALDQANSKLDQAKTATAKAKTDVANLPDGVIVADLRRKLGMRPSSDPFLSLYPEELRKADEMVSENSGLHQQIDGYDAKIEAIKQNTQAVLQRLEAKDAEAAALRAYATDVTGLYVRAHNAAQPRVSALHKAVTLNCLFRGCVKKLDLPDPATLKMPAPPEKKVTQ